MLNEFIDSLFGSQTGIVYAPIKSRSSFKFHQRFFSWPEEKEALLDHLREKSKNYEVYISPCLFSERRVSPDTFKGTYHLWAEFDGKLPKEVAVQPSIVIKSSANGYAHWYWRLKDWTTDPNIVTNLTKKLTYHFDADRSGWDYAQILRPPETYNHKRGLPVELQELNSDAYDLSDFDFLPDPPVAALKPSVHSVEDLPKIDPIIAKYPWKEDTYELFNKSIKHPHRSDALARLAFDCVEMGMSNVEIIAILEDADRRWKKFYGRTDRIKRLFGILEYVRTQKAVQQEVVLKEGSVFRFLDFIQTKINLDWIVEGLLPVAGSGIIYGQGGIGKSTLSLRMGMSIALGKESFLKWPIVKKFKRVLFLSLEMAHDELKSFFVDMDLTEQEIQVLQNRFFIWPLGHAFPLDVKEYQEETLRYIDLYEIDLIIIDSLSVAMYGSVTSDDDIKRLNSFLNEDLRKERECAYWLVHHPHKPNIDRKGTEFDMFGSVYIGYNAQTIVSMSQRSQGTNRLTLNVLKNRLSLDKPRFDVFRKPNRTFELVEANSAPSRDSPTTDSGGEKDVFKVRNNLFGAVGRHRE